ncbi:MAG TPA: 2-hydroxyacyl-CoA dehydratase family protein [Nitrospirota bacterium]|nr:2-hydroxyacyl-CoA dehydratase family protein [Nitrospirota bacterium]
MEKIGFTTTVPVEVILAAGAAPVDLSNTFINSADPALYVDEAEALGLPRTTCGWIKGLYTAAKDAGVAAIVAVTQGDCSNTHALMELWQADGLRIIPFAYPYDRDRDLLRLQVRKLMDALGADEASVARVFESLRPLRKKLARLDELTWRTGQVSGGENHRWLVSASDFEGDPASFETGLDAFLSQAEVRPPSQDKTVRIGYIGVPPIFTDIYEVLESAGARVVFNETQRQFSMPYDTPDIYVQYALYTYPYDVFGRIADIKEQARLRGLDGIIHYCQSFCFRAIEDLLMRRALGYPMLTAEGDRPGPVDARTRIRLEGFVEMLTDMKGAGSALRD